MIIHCTKKLAVKIPSVSKVALEETSPLGSWHAHLYIIERRQCVLFCHDASRFMLFLPGVTKQHFVDLGDHHRELFLATLRAFKVDEVRLKAVALALGPVRYDTATNRSVLGSMKTARSDLGAWLYLMPNIMAVDPVELAHDINQRPASISKEWIRPNKVMLAAVESL